MGQTLPPAFAAGSALLTAHVACDADDPVADLRAALGAEELSLIYLFVSNTADFDHVVRRADECFGDTPVVCCTTAGEISAEGYTEGEIVAVALPSRLFLADTMLIEPLDEIDPQTLIGDVIRARAKLTHDARDMAHEFAFLTVDGLSRKEDELMSALAPGLGPMQLFGGSAGDGEDFADTYVSYGGKTYQNAAVLSLVRTRCPVKVFSLAHLTPTDTRMVVTRADPSRRVVHEINAEPAAREYARILGMVPEQLDTFTYAAHPVVVRIGGAHHVRAIQRIEDSDDLVFFSAIDEGLVLTLAEPEDLADHLQRELKKLADAGPLDTIFACDCLLRRIEAEQDQQTSKISKILKENRVVGFATYGEQIDAKHVNHTMTGVAIYLPES
ncbi:FIST N-terminal domain-containing protein [Litorivita sp. NS0012-18]|uniref:FIST N-terminal domain-containing protein n=1 Tax=Litorivita sp. NS0012-18 TaxID=3127655 RepID=UPI00310C2D8A